MLRKHYTGTRRHSCPRPVSWTFFFAVLTLTSCSRFSNSLSQQNGAATGRKGPIKRVAVVGAGIAGLSLAHSLKNSPSLNSDGNVDMEVSLFDSRPSLNYKEGSGVQLNGGLAVLGMINSEVQKAVIDAAVPIGTLRGRNKSWKDENSEDTLWDFDVDTLFRKAGGKAAEAIIVGDTVMWFGIMRGALQEALLNSLPKDKSLQVSFGKTLVGITDSDGGAFCEFSDGSRSGPYDLIAGCDGIKSAVKEYIEKGKISDDPSKREGNAAALYSGIRIGFAVTEKDKPDTSREPRSIKQLFADGAYVFSGTFGNGKNRPPCDCLFVISLDEKFNGPFKRKQFSSAPEAAENADWAQDVLRPKQESRERMIQQLNANKIPGQDAAAIVESADRFFELGVYFHNPFSFAGWKKEVPSTDGCFTVLCGDSAHAMPPFLGQGANQAIQDAYSLAQKIHSFNTGVLREQEETEEGALKDIKVLLQEYESARWGSTTSITGKAAILGYLETGGRDGFYAKFRDVFFKVLSFAGIPQLVLTDAATPKL